MENKNFYDVIVIGGGPGGYGAALYTSRANLTTLVVEKFAPGNIIMLAFRSFLFKICTKRFIPVTDIFCGIVKGIPEVSGTSFLHMGITVV